MMRIWKYSLHLCNKQFIDVPDGADPVHFQRIGEMVRLWAKVDVSQPLTQMEVIRVATGQTIPAQSTYLGTVVMPNQLVWHYFWRPRKTE